jgi:hypothetical protein
MANGYPGLVALTVFAATACAPAIDFQPHDDRYPACGRRAPALRVDSGDVAFVGIVRQLDDATPVDGPVRIVLIDSEGTPRKLFFGSLFTVPASSEQRKSVYRAIAASQVGDCVRLSGAPRSDGSVDLEQFENLDRSPGARP